MPKSALNHIDHESQSPVPAETLPGEFTPVSWIPPENMTWDEWMDAGDGLKFATKGIHFWLGDWINAGEYKFGEQYAQALSEVDFSYGTLQRDVFVASRIPAVVHIDGRQFILRRINLSWSMHYAVACFCSDLDDTDEERWLKIDNILTKAEQRGWTKRKAQSIFKRWDRVFGGAEQLSAGGGTAEPPISSLPLYTAAKEHLSEAFPWTAAEDRDEIAQFVTDLVQKVGGDGKVSSAWSISARRWRKKALRAERYYLAWRTRAIRAEEQMEALQVENRSLFKQVIDLQELIAERERLDFQTVPLEID